MTRTPVCVKLVMTASWRVFSMGLPTSRASPACREGFGVRGASSRFPPAAETRIALLPRKHYAHLRN
jgi:hypothetical protein